MEEIKQTANKKRLNEEAEKFQEKVSRCTAKTIKLKVAQDAAYWDLNEKLQQLEGNYERLQQNMVEVQMQYETKSGQYQDELHLRQDILNQQISTHERRVALDDYVNKLTEILSQYKANLGVLSAAYQNLGHLVQNLAQRQEREKDQKRLLTDGLQDKANEHDEPQLQLLLSTSQQAKVQICELKEKLETELCLARDVVGMKQTLDLRNCDFQQTQETIENLQKEIEEIIQEFNTRNAHASNILLKQENELKEALEGNDSLKLALTNQEGYTKTVCEQNNIYQEKLAKLEEEKAMSIAIKQELEDKLQDLPSYEEVTKLNEQIDTINNENSEIITNLSKTNQQIKEKYNIIEELTANIDNLNIKLANIQNEHKVICEASEGKIKDLKKTIEARDKELESKAGSVTHLMSELNITTGDMSILNTTLQKVKKEMEIEGDNEKERERKINDDITKLENEILYKDEELSKQMTIILDLKNETKRLQEKSLCMQNTIESIEKEAMGRRNLAPAPELHEPERDDNAVMLPPRNKIHKPPSTITQGNAVAAPHNNPDLDDVVYHLFSDSSANEDNTLDGPDINRRFEALMRGESLSPLPLSALRRRCAGPPRADTRRQSDNATSLSQIKNNINKERRFFKNKRSNQKTKNKK